MRNKNKTKTPKWFAGSKSFLVALTTFSGLVLLASNQFGTIGRFLFDLFPKAPDHEFRWKYVQLDQKAMEDFFHEKKCASEEAGFKLIKTKTNLYMQVKEDFEKFFRVEPPLIHSVMFLTIINRSNTDVDSVIFSGNHQLNHYMTLAKDESFSILIQAEYFSDGKPEKHQEKLGDVRAYFGEKPVLLVVRQIPTGGESSRPTKCGEGIYLNYPY